MVDYIIFGKYYEGIEIIYRILVFFFLNINNKKIYVDRRIFIVVLWG